MESLRQWDTQCLFMSKTTFKGYVPSLKLKGAEATIVEGKAIESKGGSIRYTLRGEYEGRPTLPKTVSKHDFENVYGFDAKEAEAVIITGKEAIGMGKKDVVQLHIVGEEDTMDFTPEKIVPITKYYKSETVVGSPSPADVEPPAPSEKPFPQEPTNENFSAETNFDCIVCDSDLEDIVKGHEEGSWITCQGDYAGDENACGRFFCSNHSNREDFKCPKCGGYEDRLTGTYRDFEAFGLFGGKDEEEEEEKPKQQEFTVIMQEGDKLELTDIEEKEESGDDTKDGNSDEDSENDEKEAESNCDCGCSIGECKCPEGCKCGCGDHDAEYEAVQAKVTRPVKEEKEEVKDDEEGGVDLGTIATVGAVGLGALAVGALLTAEDESDYWAGEDAYWRAEGGDADSTVVWELIQQNLNNPDAVRLYYEVMGFGDPDEYEGDDMATTVAEGFQQNSQNQDFINHLSQKLGFEAEGGGEIDHDRIDTYEEAEVHFRHDYPTTHYEWTTSKDDLTDEEEDMVDDEVRSDIGSEPEEGEDWDSIDVDGVGTVNYSKDTDYGEKRFYGLNAEDFQKMTPSEFVPFDQMQEELGQMWDETTAPLADAHNYDYEPSNEPSNANFSAETSTKQGWEITHYGGKNDTRIAKKDGLSVYIEKLPKNSIQHKRDGANWRVTYGRYFDDGSGGRIIPLAELFRTYNDIFTWLNNPPFTIHNHAETFEARTTRKEKRPSEMEHYYERRDGDKTRTHDLAKDLRRKDIPLKVRPTKKTPSKKYFGDTVGSPSPSGPSSIPEPAEATGSEPSNEHMKAEGNAQLAMGLTAVGLGLAVWLGKDRLGKLFDRFNL